MVWQAIAWCAALLIIAGNKQKKIVGQRLYRPCSKSASRITRIYTRIAGWNSILSLSVLCGTIGFRFCAVVVVIVVVFLHFRLYIFVCCCLFVNSHALGILNQKSCIIPKRNAISNNNTKIEQLLVGRVFGVGFLCSTSMGCRVEFTSVSQ